MKSKGSKSGKLPAAAGQKANGKSQSGGVTKGAHKSRKTKPGK